MLSMTKYYDEFLRYHKMAKWQHKNCNLGVIPYDDTPWDDDLIKNVFIYDVVERKYAGFTQLILDMWYDYENHPYKNKMNEKRKSIVDSFSNTNSWKLTDWLFVFFVHRLTGSGINYSLSPTGYFNSILLKFNECNGISDMIEVIKNHNGPMYTSIGYQIAPFPKPKGNYVRGGDWFICEILPILVYEFSKFLEKGKKNFRDLMSWLEQFNVSRNFRVFRFQYAATLADIADFFPNFINLSSQFFYGKNAIECLSYLAEKPKTKSNIEFLDLVLERICEDTNMIPYNAEDVACDFIRWVENYINPKMDYSHLCLDSIWSSHTILDHPFGRQKKMLELNFIDTFNGKPHPSNDKVLNDAGVTIQQYKNMIND